MTIPPAASEAGFGAQRMVVATGAVDEHGDAAQALIDLAREDPGVVGAGLVGGVADGERMRRVVDDDGLVGISLRA